MVVTSFAYKMLLVRFKSLAKQTEAFISGTHTISNKGRDSQLLNIIHCTTLNVSVTRKMYRKTPLYMIIMFRQM